MKLSRYVLYYGQDAPLPAQKELRAGPLSLLYEAGDLRYIHLGDQEILRRVYAAVRDRNWGTVPPLFSHVQMDIAADSFYISYDVENKQGGIDFFWRGQITGEANGTITFTMEGVARSTFLRNRIGFCLLHPSRECAGRPVTVERVDGPARSGAFPLHIDPRQPVEPFAEMSGLSYEISPGLTVELRFSGDVFELEDQRNWTDASYKTFCTPLHLPFPVEIKAGSRVSQTVTLTLKGQVPEIKTGATMTGLTFSVGTSSIGSLPRLGLAVAGHGRPLNPNELARLKALNLSHLRVDLKPAQPDWEATLRRAAAEAGELNLPLEVALFLSDPAEEELQRLATALAQLRPMICRWLVFHTAEKASGAPWVNLARRRLAGYNPAAQIGSGANADFFQLNQTRPSTETLDFVCYSINPQSHAFDNASLAETLEAQAATVASARHFFPDLPIVISPVTLKPRFNPVATGPEPPTPPGELPRPVDARQMSLFGAGWTAGSLKYLAESGVQSVTCYETTGWRGVMETEAGSPLPDKFQSLPGSVFPLYHVLADVGEFSGGEVLPTASSQTLVAAGLAVRKNGQTRVLLANLSHEPQQVTIQNLAEQVRVRALDETNAEAAMQAPEEFRAQAGELRSTSAGTLRLSLRPYAVARLDMPNASQNFRSWRIPMRQRTV
ncbi:MAG: hypothetical protein AB1801_05480 [Chloroflexota bacterium]